jgi:hypothetical protein
MITWIKKFDKGHSERHRPCLDVGIFNQKLKKMVKTRYASKVIMFQETFKYHDVINLCYGRQESQ